MKPQLLKGTRDFLPKDIARRKYIFSIIESVFIKYGFYQIETPAMEAMSTLTGKYGDEGDKLLFKILNNGDFLEKVDEEALASKNSAKVATEIAKRGLRYDLTVPFARFVVMHQNDISFPFKRYQIQPVWRADRPQKGRYQEFYQCDADIVGSDSLVYEAELVQMYHEVFDRLKVGVRIQINNRKILYGIAEYASITDKFVDMTMAIDKLDKIGRDGVRQELIARELTEDSIDKIFNVLDKSEVEDLKELFEIGSVGLQGVEEVRTVLNYLKADQIKNLDFDIKLARGLGYYTGCIFEVAVDENIHPDIKMGSIGGGGRYADLTGTFGMSGVSGVGVSFGVERIYDVLEELEGFPEEIASKPKILFAAFDEATQMKAFEMTTQLRREEISCVIYPEHGKMKKALKHASDNGITYAGIIGQDELENNTVMVKNLDLGTQESMDYSNLVQFLNQ